MLTFIYVEGSDSQRATLKGRLPDKDLGVCPLQLRLVYELPPIAREEGSVCLLSLSGIGIYLSWNF